MNATKPILLVEDDHVDVMAVKRSMKMLEITTPLVVTSNGEEALTYLEDDTLPVPSLILLDINMPKMNGVEFLRIVKEHDHFRRIPVVILTTSKEDEDRFDTFDLGASGYMLKPVDFSRFVEVMRTIHAYWILSESSDRSE